MRSVTSITKSALAAAALAATVATPKMVSAHQGDYAELAERVSPAVVNIFTTQTVDRSTRAMPFPESHPFREFFDRFGMPGPNGMPGRSEPAEALGSGFIFDPLGYVITNNHVVENTDSVKIKLSDDREYEARIVGTDERTDIALLKIEDSGRLPFVSLGDSDALRVGEEVMAVGNPFGLGGTVTTGIVSATGRNIRVGGPYIDYIQTDASINRGNSGGPLFNMRGKVVGVNAAIYSPTGGSVGLGFAVPSNTVKRIVDDLKANGVVNRGWLGVRIQPVTDAIASALGTAEKRGALVAGVEDGAPASGILRSGDLILSFNDVQVERSRDLPRIVAGTPPNTAVPVRIMRDGTEQVVMVTVGQLKDDRTSRVLPASTGRGIELSRFGATLAPSPSGEGALVTELDPNGSAAKGGLETGDVILKVGDRIVSGPADVQAKLADVGGGVLLLVKRDGTEIYVGVTPSAS